MLITITALDVLIICVVEVAVFAVIMYATFTRVINGIQAVFALKSKTVIKANNEKMEQLCSEMCDQYCIYPSTCGNEEELENYCEKCPLNKLMIKERSR